MELAVRTLIPKWLRHWKRI